MNKGMRVSSSQARASHECIMSPRLSSSSCHLHHRIKAIIKATIIMMYIRSSSSQLDQSPQELHHIIKIKQSSTRRLLLHKPSLSRHHGLHHIIRVLMGHQRTIISNQGSKHRIVTTARVTIRKAIHDCCWHQG